MRGHLVKVLLVPFVRTTAQGYSPLASVSHLQDNLSSGGQVDERRGERPKVWRTYISRICNWRASLTLDNRMRHMNENVEQPIRNHLRAGYNRVWILEDVSILIEKT